MRDRRICVAPYKREDRRALLELEWHSHWTHKHLDWHATAEWLDLQLGQAMLAWQGPDLVGYIGFSRPRAGWSWVRLLGIRDGCMPGAVVGELWAAAEARCRERGARDVLILMVTNWLPRYFSKLGFRFEQDIVTLELEPGRVAAAGGSDVAMRPAEREDLPQMAKIDQLAFDPPWQLTRTELWKSLRVCVDSSVATADGAIAAYQLCSRQEELAHIARLAVDPAHQRRGLGAALLGRYLQGLRARSNGRLASITVNTQARNLPSQRLYQRFGFARNGFDLELWRKRLN